MDDSTPAFPANHYDLADGEHGLSVRDYFAAKAMQTILADMRISQTPTVGYSPNAYIAKLAYLQADAMLRAREGK